jgi:hypothetical protein
MKLKNISFLFAGAALVVAAQQIVEWGNSPVPVQEVELTISGHTNKYKYFTYPNADGSPRTNFQQLIDPIPGLTNSAAGA